MARCSLDGGARVVTPRQRLVELRRPVAPFALDARRGVRAVQRACGRGRAASRVCEAEGDRRRACGEEADSGAQLEDAARTDEHHGEVGLVRVMG